MKKILIKNKGFTLVELIIYMGIFAIVISILTTLFSSIIDTQLSSQSLSTVQQNGRYLLQRLMYDISRASAIVTPSSIGSSGSTLVLTIGGTNYQYALNGSTLTITNLSTSSTDNLTGYDANVTSFTVARYGNSGGKNAIQVNFSLSSATQKVNGAETAAFQTTVGTR